MSSSRGNPAMADILRSVAVMGGIVLVLYAVGLFFTRSPDEPVRAVDHEPTAISAAEAATYPLLTPSALPDGWRSNGVRFEPGGTQPWHLGILTDEDRYIGLEQEKLPAADLLRVHAEDAQPDGTVDIDGVTWQFYSGPDERFTLVLETPEVTTLVTTGTVSRTVVIRYISSLVPASELTADSASVD